MSTSVQELLSKFDRLSPPEQLELASEILKRTPDFEFSALTDESLVWSAEELFLELDTHEAADE